MMIMELPLHQVNGKKVFGNQFYNTNSFTTIIKYKIFQNVVASLCLCRTKVKVPRKLPSIAENNSKNQGAGNYIFKVNKRNTRTRCEICSNLTIKTPERHQWHCSGVFIVNFEHISYLALKFL